MQQQWKWLMDLFEPCGRIKINKSVPQVGTFVRHLPVKFTARVGSRLFPTLTVSYRRRETRVVSKSRLTALATYLSMHSWHCVGEQRSGKR